MTSRDAEQKELARAVELIGRGTRPGRLLEYLGAKTFLQQEERLTEFNIATEVFGRSAKNFDSTEDAVVRVEAHRLRKKLRDIYEQDARPSGMQISLPAGTYVPKFTALPERPADVSQPVVSAAPVQEVIAPHPLNRPRSSTWVWSVAILAGIAAIVIAVGMNGRSRHVAPTAPPQDAKPEAAATADGVASTEVHVVSGYSGSEVGADERP